MAQHALTAGTVNAANMPPITLVTTRTGDTGETSLGNGEKIKKDSLRIESIGQVDELNSILGVVLSLKPCPEISRSLQEIQNTLFHLGSELAKPNEGPTIEPRHIDALEEVEVHLLPALPVLENFILPGGSLPAAQLQLARTVCRRAERSLTALMSEGRVSLLPLKYLNRLSDTLFIMGRYQNQQDGIIEKYWDSRA